MDTVVMVLDLIPTRNFLPGGEWCKNVIFDVDNNLSVHGDNRKKIYPNSWSRANK